MKILGYLAFIGAVGYVLFTYWDGSGHFNLIKGEMRRAEDKKRAEELVRIKQRYWAGFYQAPNDCAAPKSALRELECKNQADQAWGRFDRQWDQKIASGWSPPELAK